MTILSALRGRGSELEVRSQLENPLRPLTDASLAELWAPPKVTAGVPVSEYTSLGMSAVWRAVNLLAGTIAALPLHPFQTDSNDVQRKVTSGNAARLLDKPHPDMTPMELWEVAIGHVALWGNCYLQIRRDKGSISELWPIHPSKVKPGRASDGTKLYIVNGETVLFDDGLLHIPGFGYDGIIGLSPIQMARQGIGLALAAEQFGAGLFGSGSLMSGLLTTDRVLTEPQATALKTRWAAKTRGLANAHDVPILDAGAKFQPLTIPPEDAQFIESRRFQIAEVARMFGVPPHMLGETDKSTSWGSGIEQQGIGFIVYTLQPWITRFEQRITKLLTPGPVYAKYSVEGLLRGDSAQRSAFYTSMWGIGVYSTNDIRRLENLPPVEGGDVRYRPLNMGELGQPDPEPAPAPAADPSDDDTTGEGDDGSSDNNEGESDDT